MVRGLLSDVQAEEQDPTMSKIKRISLTFGRKKSREHSYAGIADGGERILLLLPHCVDLYWVR